MDADGSPKVTLLDKVRITSFPCSMGKTGDYEKMKDSNRKKEELITELQELRRRIKELETAEFKQKYSDKEVSKREERYREFFINAETHRFLLLDSSFNIIEANNVLRETWTTLLGIGKEEIVGRNFLDLVPYFREHERLDKYKEVMKTGSPFYTEDVTPPPEYGGLHLSVSVFKAGDGLGIITTDITERKRAEAALRTTQETVESSISGIALSDIDGRLTYVNTSFLRLWGHKDKKEVLEKSVLDFWKSREQAANVIEELNNKGSWTGELIAQKKDGSLFHVRLTASMSRNAEGKPVSMMGSFIDITEQKRMEESFANIQRLESLGVLAGGIAHDFNNLLTPILANISLVKTYEEIDSELSELLNDAEKAALRAIGLTQQLLTFAKGGAPIKNTVSVARFLKENVGFALSGSNVGCEFTLPDHLWLVEMDEGQISQVIHNLVLNALQAMAEGGVLRVGAENATFGEKGPLSLGGGKYVIIEIEDEGIGIPEKQLSRIFDPFFSTKEKGRGLGLTTSLSIIKRHEGSIHVDSIVGERTTFRIYLPASEAKSEPEEKERISLLKGTGKILLVDDEEMVRRSAAKLLERLGYRVEIAKDGTEGIQAYKSAMEEKKPFDAVLMDLTIPGGMGGKEAVKRLMELDPEAKIIVSSGYSDDPIMSHFEAYGFCGVIAKPYHIEGLGELLRKVLGQKN